MANVNLQTGKIYGCKKKSLKYFHEEGHLLFEDEAYNGNLIRQIQSLSLMFMIYLAGFVALFPNDYFKAVLISLMFTNIFSEMFEERWCWLYAKQKYGEIKRKNKNP